MTDEELALLTACIDDPSPDRKLVFSDWLLDHGREDEAHAYRWAAKWGRHPKLSQGRRVVRWGRVWEKRVPLWPKNKKPPHLLPCLVADAIKDGCVIDGSRHEGHLAFQRAMQALAAALRALLDAAS